jgi:hypothetical protein
MPLSDAGRSVNRFATLPSITRWAAPGRLFIFILAAASIWCLLAEFYGICSMRFFTIWILIPATALLIAVAMVDYIAGKRDLARSVLRGGVAGLIAAAAYDMFRLPFVFSRAWGLERFVPQMNLFKVFPRFGAMILGQPIEQAVYSTAAQVIGWAYHFSNGITFGIMYLAIIGDAGRRSWAWAVLLAAGIELAMLTTPYAKFFSIPLTGTFVAVTLAAHVIFGIALGLCARALARLQRAEFKVLAEGAGE